MSDEEIITKDQIFIVSTGSYSDYGVSFVARALKDFNEVEAWDLYDKIVPAESYEASDWRGGLKTYYKRRIHFDSWLVNESGLAEEIEYQELHIDDSWDASKRPSLTIGKCS